MSNNARYFLAFWSREGFEAIEDITKYEDWDKNQLFNIIADKGKKSCPMYSMISHMKLRMRFNPQREYEIYAFMSTPEIDREELIAWSNNDPQSFVNWIRENGIKIASDRGNILSEKVVIV